LNREAKLKNEIAVRTQNQLQPDVNANFQVLEALNELVLINSREQRLSKIEGVDNLPDHPDLSEKIRFYHIKELNYEDEFPRREIFENFISTLNNPNFNFIYIISGDEKGVNIYVGVNNIGPEDYNISVNNYGKEVLMPCFTGNFSGSKLENLRKDSIKANIIENIMKADSISFLSGIPSVFDNEKMEKFDFQGVERLINSLRGKTYQIVIIAEPVDKTEINQLKENIYNLYNRLMPISSAQVGYGQSTGTSRSDTEGENSGESETFGTSKSRTKGTSHSYTDGDVSDGTNSSKT